MDVNQTNAHAAILRAGDGFTFGPAHKTRECAERGVSPFEGAEILGFAELFPAPIMGMHFALQRHRNQTIAELRELQRQGVRIQAYTVEGDDGSLPLESVEGRGYWRDLPADKPVQFACHLTRYRPHPDDLAATIPDEEPDSDTLVDGEGFEAIEVLQALAEKLHVPCTHAAIEDAIDSLRAKQLKAGGKVTDKQCAVCGFVGQEDPVIGCPRCKWDEMQPVANTADDAVAQIAAERRRQIEAEGLTPEHDDQHVDRDLAAAASAYAYFASLADLRRNSRRAKFDDGIPDAWPWGPSWWKPGNSNKTSDRVRELVKAGALIVAEIERLQRADGSLAARSQSDPSGVES